METKSDKEVCRKNENENDAQNEKQAQIHEHDQILVPLR